MTPGIPMRQKKLLNFSIKINALLRQIGGHGERGEVVLVLHVDGCPALHGHVEHLHVVKHNEDVGDGTAIDVLLVGVAALLRPELINVENHDSDVKMDLKKVDLIISCSENKFLH